MPTFELCALVVMIMLGMVGAVALVVKVFGRLRARRKVWFVYYTVGGQPGCPTPYYLAGYSTPPTMPGMMMDWVVVSNAGHRRDAERVARSTEEAHCQDVRNAMRGDTNHRYLPSPRFIRLD